MPSPTRRALAVGLLLLAACRAERVEPPAAAAYPHALDSIGTVREIYDGTLSPELAVNTFRNIDRLFPSRTIAAGGAPRALPPAARPLGEIRIASGDTTVGLEAYLELDRVAAVLVLKDGAVALERYRYGNTTRTRWMSMSVAKSVTSTLIGAALRDGRIRSLDDSVTRYVPALAGSAYDGVTIRDVLLMASGARWSERYTDPTSDRRRLLEAQLSQVPGSAMAVMRSLPRAAPPGTRNNYSTGETQVAAEILRGALGGPLAPYLSERIWTRAGMEADATWWLDSPDGVEIGGSGISATLRDYARFGQFILEDGVVAGDSILPAGWVREATTPKVLRGGAKVNYGYLWWTAISEPARSHGAFNAEGIHGQFIWIDPAERVVIVVLSARPHPTEGAVVSDYRFFDAVVAALATEPPPQ
ncbi:MAG: beta-lactamase family protein [Gemmatimonadales bacterium]|nr:beta-lactamase family protein [Gemmatimonadales bacterium]